MTIKNIDGDKVPVSPAAMEALARTQLHPISVNVFANLGQSLQFIVCPPVAINDARQTMIPCYVDGFPGSKRTYELQLSSFHFAFLRSINKPIASHKSKYCTTQHQFKESA